MAHRAGLLLCALLALGACGEPDGQSVSAPQDGEPTPPAPEPDADPNPEPNPETPEPGPAPEPGVDPTPDPEPALPEGCDPEEAAHDLPLRRLSRAQYLYTLRDLLGLYLEPDHVDGIFDWGVPDLVARLPPDERHGRPGEHRGGFTRADQTVHQEHVDVTMEMAARLAEELIPPWRVDQMLAPCDDAFDDACVADFVRRFGLQTHRRPLDDAEVDDYMALFADSAAAYVPGPDDWSPELFARAKGMRDIATAMMAMPWFLYHVEHGDAPAEGVEGAFVISDHELANRLSYHFWQTMPDAELLAAVEDGSLRTPEGYAAQIERLYNDPRTQRSLREFFREWLRLDDLPEMNRLSETRIYEAFAEGFEPSRDLREHMMAELEDLGLWYAHAEPGSFENFVRSDLLLTSDPALASLYGASPWDGQGTPPRLTEPTRAGLITRAGMLASGSANTRPIVKGVRVREALLCAPIPPPPDNAAAFPPPLSEESTTREVVEALTEQPGSSCAGCHTTLINPYGFATEGFDALGRPRTDQRLFDQWGQLVAERAVDTTTEIISDGRRVPVADAQGLSEALMDSGELERCFARHYAEFTFGRHAEGNADACVIDDLEARLRAGDSLSAVLRDVALQPSFQRRTMELP